MVSCDAVLQNDLGKAEMQAFLNISIARAQHHTHALWTDTAPRHLCCL